MSTFPSRNRIYVMLGWIMAGLVFGVLFQTARVALAPQLSASTAKLKVFDFPPPETVCWPEERNSLVKVLDETFQPEALGRRANLRLQALQPELKPCEIETRVSLVGSNDLYQVTAAGTDPTYTRQHLDALLDEFLAFRREVRSRECRYHVPPPRDRIDAVVQERASPAVIERKEWLKPLLLGAGAGMLGGFVLFYLVSMGLALRALLAPS